MVARKETEMLGAALGHIICCRPSRGHPVVGRMQDKELLDELINEVTKNKRNKKMKKQQSTKLT